MNLQELYNLNGILARCQDLLKKLQNLDANLNLLNKNHYFEDSKTKIEVKRLILSNQNIKDETIQKL